MSDRIRRFLFIVRSCPLAGANAREALDSVLTVAAFEQPVRMLFLDDGAFHLLRVDADASADTPSWTVLDLYGIDDVWVERESLEGRGLRIDELAIAARLVPRAELAALWADRRIVVVC